MPRLRLKKTKQLVFFVFVVVVSLGSVYWSKQALAPTKGTTKPGSVSVAPTFNKNQFSINDPSSLWVVVDKGRELPVDYVPADLTTPSVALRLGSGSPEMKVRGEVANALEQMFTAAAGQKLSLMLTSGYRSYSEQVALYQSYVKQSGVAHADASSAHPGHSEHQTGLAADLEPASRSCELDPCFGDTPEGKWLVANAASYGFIIRYQKGQENLSGYEYEPWHVRYVGADLATQIVKSGQTLEQFFNLPAVIQYPAQSFQLKAGS